MFCLIKKKKNKLKAVHRKLGFKCVLYMSRKVFTQQLPEVLKNQEGVGAEEGERGQSEIVFGS